MKNKLKVVYEDNHVIVVIKPFNFLSQSDSTNDLDMLTIVKLYLKEKYNKPGNVYSGLVHRLDRPTLGLMVFAKTSKAAARLSEQLRNNNFSKHYLAITENKIVPLEGKYQDYLLKDNNNTSKVVKKELGKEAILDYRVLDYKDNMSLVDVKLITGRHHQIRVQFAHRGYPLYGDQRYGKQDKKQLALIAYNLEFIHPTTKEKMEFSIEKPNIYPWTVFNNSK